jgi:hypothetical protein
MQTTEDAAIWAQVGNSVVNVGNVRAGQILAVVPRRRTTMNFASVLARVYRQGHLEPVQGKQRVEDGLGI